MTLSRFSLSVAIGLAGAVSGFAQSPAAPVAPVAPAKPPVAEPYPLKNRSSFDVPAETRPPFWPVGWVKKSDAAIEPEKPKVQLDESMFTISSILLGNPSLAIINGRTYSEGEFLRLPKDPATAKPPAGKAPPLPPNLRIRVHRISDGNVTLHAEGQMIVVALRRPELPDKKPAEELLNEQR